MSPALALFLALLSGFPHKVIDGRDFVRPEDLSLRYQFSIRGSGERLFLSGPYGSAEIPRASGLKMVRVNGRSFLTEIRKTKKGELLLAASGADLILTHLLKKRVYWDHEGKSFFVLPERPTIKGIWTKGEGDSFFVQITFWKPLKPEIRSFSGGTEIWIPGGFYPGPRYRKGDGRVVDRLEVSHSRRGGWVRVFHGSETLLAHSRKSKDRIALWFRYQGKPHDEIRDEIQVVVIDPGHGGRDPGAIGPRGRKEKDIALAIAKRVKRILERETRLKVVLTRERDVFVPLDRRAEIANRAEGDLFVSIHCNFVRQRHISGVETYFLSEAKTEWERAVAAFENASIRYEIEENGDTAGGLKYVLMDMAQNHYLRESQELAGEIHRAVVQITGARDRRVRQAGFYVLHGPFMPAVLVEVGFISNRAEEKRLSDPRYQEKIARGIAEGIKAYVRQQARQAHRGL